jgi:DNA mismatch repair protein MutL
MFGYKLSGLISRPELTRPRRDRLLLAVNGRPVQWHEKWLKGILQAYGDLLPIGHYPVGVLNLEVPPELVLVNTAPDKRSVRFLHEDKVLAFLHEAVQANLSKHPLAPALPQFAPLEPLSSAPQHSFPALQHVGTYRDLYLLAQAHDTLWVVDQHAAHERILFEELEKRYQQETPLELRQVELMPFSLEDSARYEARKDELASLGFKLEPFGGSQWRVRTVPAFLAAHPELVAEIVKEALLYDSLEKAWRRILGRLACLPAIKAGHPLSKLEAQSLLTQLQNCHTPWSCPHGRPTALVLSELDLAKKFGRSNVRVSTHVSNQLLKVKQ